MKKILLLLTILLVSVSTTACINNLAIQELNNKAESFMDKGETDAAICRLKASLDLDNEVFQTHYNLAVAYSKTDNYEGAIEECKKVLELKPDFYDALYIIAISKEAMAYQVIDVENPDELSLDAMADFNNKAAEAVDAYNKYLESKANAPETEKVNEKIAELNQKIKEYTDTYDRKSSEEQQQIQNEITSSDDNNSDDNQDDAPQDNDDVENNN